MIRLSLIAALPFLGACATPQGRSDASPPSGPDRPLTTWTLVSIDGQPARSSRAQLSIYQKRIAATVGCNGMGGDLEVSNGRFKVGPIISTQMYCEELMEQERAVAEMLGASPAFFIENGRMGIRSDRHVAELVRKTG